MTLSKRYDYDEDVLQDAYLRFARAEGVRDSEAFLVTTVSWLCHDRLRSARARREVYVGPWLPEPIADAEALSPHATTELSDSLSFALMLALELLNPAERAAFLLHDVFDVSFARIAGILGKTEAACRQLAALLRADAIAVTDGGRVKPAALKPIRGTDKITRLYIALARKYAADGVDIRLVPAAINGAPGCSCTSAVSRSTGKEASPILRRGATLDEMLAWSRRW